MKILKWFIWCAISLIFLGAIILPFIVTTPIDVEKLDESDMLSYYGAVLSCIGTVSLGALALWQNYLINKQHLDSLKPELSMQMTSIGGFLYLRIENTGMTTAKNITITALELQNNGTENEFELDGLFNTTFELHSKESIHGKFANDGSSLFDEIFPIIKIKVSYIRTDCNKKVEFERTVVYDGIGKKQEDNGTLTKIQSDIDKVARANVRIANYLDGNKVAKFDELNIISNRSLREDLLEVKEKQVLTDETVKSDHIATIRSDSISAED